MWTLRGAISDKVNNSALQLDSSWLECYCIKSEGRLDNRTENFVCGYAVDLNVSVELKSNKRCLIYTGFILLGLIPLLIGLLFDVVIIVPLRVPLNQTPIFYLWQDWAFGVLHTKVICGIAMMGEWRLREVLEEVMCSLPWYQFDLTNVLSSYLHLLQIYHAGLLNINMRLIIGKLALPVVIVLGLVLALPYISVVSIAPLFSATFETQTLMLRRIYPFLLFASGIIYMLHWQIRKFTALYDHIKNDKYLVGKRLVNYDPNRPKAPPAAEKSPLNNQALPLPQF